MCVLAISTTVLSLLLGPDEVLIYRAPDTATAEDLGKAAQAITARCKGYGFKGVVAKGLEEKGQKIVKISSESGFTEDMKKTIGTFTQIAALAPELRYVQILSGTEKEQYQPQSAASEDTAPPGTRWYRWWTGDERPVLLRDTPVVEKGDLSPAKEKLRSGEERRIWEISSMKTRDLRDADRKIRLGLPYLVLEGRVFESIPIMELERHENGKVVPAERLSFVPGSKLSRELLENPLPFPLCVMDVATTKPDQKGIGP